MNSVKLVTEVLHSDAKSYELHMNIYVYILSVVVIFLRAPSLVKSVRPSLSLSKKQRDRKNEPSKFSPVPLWMDSTLGMVERPRCFFDFLLSRSSSGEASFLQPGSLVRDSLAHTDEVVEVFQRSKKLTTREYSAQVLQRSNQALNNRSASQTRFSSQPKSSEISRADQVWEDFQEVSDTNLVAKDSVALIAQHFVGGLVAQFDQFPRGKWSLIGVPKLFQQHMLEASIRTLFGPSLTKDSPLFSECLWKYHKAITACLTPSSDFCHKTFWETRKECLEAVKAHLRKFWSEFDMQEVDATHGATLGSRLLREREQALTKANLSFDERAQLELELLVSIESKTIPLATYMITEILQRPDLHGRICTELKKAAKTASKRGTLAFDHAKLEQLPLLLSVYQECLRFHSSHHEAWQLEQEIKLKNSALKAGTVFLCPSYLAKQYDGTWDSAEYQSDVFWPERFLEEKPYHFGMHFPYGGGSAISSDHHYAKQEILSAVAVILAKFDFQVVSFASEPLEETKEEMERKICAEARDERGLAVRLRRR